MDTKDWVTVLTSVVQSLVLIASATWAVFLYREQKTDNFEAGKQANRSRLTEAYMHLHAAMLASEANIRIASGLIRPGYHVLGHGREKEKISTEQTHAVLILYMMFNVLYLEWTYRTTYKLNMDEFDKTVDTAINGLVNNPDPDFKDIANNFRAVFDDFPDDFKNRISERIGKMKHKK